MVQPPQELEKFSSLLKVVEALRGPQGCPWDKEQTHLSLTPYAIEEAHELAEAIETGSLPEMISELGDLLLQVILHAEIGRQSGQFSINDVIRSVNEKMIYRHPHVFGESTATTSEEVLENWSKIKEREKKGKVSAAAPFDFPASLPALARSAKIGARTKKYSFDWQNAKDVLDKVDEEIAELRAAMKSKATPRKEEQLNHELGDVLFSVAQLARHLKLDPEQSLRKANQRFIGRFLQMQTLISNDGQSFEKLKASDLERYWSRVKALETKKTHQKKSALKSRSRVKQTKASKKKKSKRKTR